MADNSRFEGSDADYKVRALGVKKEPEKEPEPLRKMPADEERIRTITHALEELDLALKAQGSGCELTGVILSDDAYRMITIACAALETYAPIPAAIPKGGITVTTLCNIPIYRESAWGVKKA